MLGTVPLVAQERPNIILFLVDDMGWQDTSVPFWNKRTPLNNTYQTPNMERLAQAGVKFTQAYACPVSSPSRISLMTGANVAQHRVSNWTLHKDQATDKASEILTFGDWNRNGMSPEPNTSSTFYSKALPAILSENGYLTGMIGKAHFGAIDTPAADPLQIGFDYNIAGHAAGAMGSYLGEQNYGNKVAGEWTRPWGVPSLEKYHGSDTFLTDALTLESCTFMEKALTEKKPFFLYLSHYAVHAPFTADKRFYQKYIDRGLPEKEAQYASLVEGMDKSLGNIMDWVADKGIAENTIIIFMSDNGGYSVGRGGEAAQRNYPLRGGKGSCFEGGIREPLIVYWPGITKPGTENKTPVIIEDFFPTLIEMAGIKRYTTPQKVDGISFVKALKEGDINEERPLYFHYPNNWGERREDVGIPQSAIRKGDWKFIYSYETEKKELFNLKEDISEKNNLINDQRYQKKGEELARILSDYLREKEATMPSFKDSKERVPYPDCTDDLNLSSMIQPVDSSSFFRDPDYFNWCNSIIKDDKGTYHLFYSRWPKSIGFFSWLTHSEIAHTTAKRPEGPYKRGKKVLTGRPGYWDAVSVHNVKVRKFDDAYYMYYSSTNTGREDLSNSILKDIGRTGYSHPYWILLRNNQRTGVATASSLNGRWKRKDKPMIEPHGPIFTITNNPAITQGEDRRYYLIIKGDDVIGEKRRLIQAIGTSDYPDGPFKLEEKPAFSDIPTEDVSMWYDKERKRFYAVFHAHGGDFIGLITSEDGINWRKAKHYKVCKKEIPMADGTIMKVDRMERPFVYVENDVPTLLCFGVKKGDDAFIVFFKLQG